MSKGAHYQVLWDWAFIYNKTLLALLLWALLVHRKKILKWAKVNWSNSSKPRDGRSKMGYFRILLYPPLYFGGSVACCCLPGSFGLPHLLLWGVVLPLLGCYSLIELFFCSYIERVGGILTMLFLIPFYLLVGFYYIILSYADDPALAPWMW